MAHFTADNTEGFTAADLATLNAAHDLIMARQQESYSADPDEELDTDTLAAISKSLDDALTNAWQPGATVAELDARVRQRGF